MSKKSIGSGIHVEFDPFHKLRAVSSTYTDERIVLARRLSREGYTYEQMAPLLGYKSAASVMSYFKVNNLPKPNLHTGTSRNVSEAQRVAQSERMRSYWEKAGVHQNNWQDTRAGKPRKVRNNKEVKQGRKSAMKYSLPEWADEMKRLHEEAGMSGIALAERYKVSNSYIYMILNILRGKGSPNTPWLGEAVKLASEGKTNAEIATKFGVTANRVRDVLNMHEASIRYRKDKENAAKEAPMSDRQFEATHQTENGVTRNGVLIRCGVDGCHKVERFIRSAGTVHPVQAAGYFRNKGWLIGAGPRADRCPEHAHKAKTAHYEPAKMEDMSPFHRDNQGNKMPAPKTPAPTQPVSADIQERNEVAYEEAVAKVSEPATEIKKEMSKADRRIIFNKIEDVYLEEATGYKSDWNDQKVADDLGVSVDWVSSIREENFGPAGNQAAVLAETREMGVKITASIAELKALGNHIKELSDAFNSKYSHLEQAAKDFAELYKSIAP